MTVLPPGIAVTSNSWMPVSAAAFQLTVADCSPAVAVTAVGAPGGGLLTKAAVVRSSISAISSSGTLEF